MGRCCGLACSWMGAAVTAPVTAADNMTAMRRSGSQRTGFTPNNILVQGSATLLDCDNPDYSTSSYTIDAPALPFAFKCGGTTFTVWRSRVARNIQSHGLCSVTTCGPLLLC